MFLRGVYMNDLEVATRYLFVDMTIKNLDLDLQHIKNGPFKIKGPYAELIEGMISKAIGERRELKSVMYKRKIQVVFMRRQGDYSTYRFVVGGKQQDKTFMHHVIKKEVEGVIRELMK